jgi:hypothetical protein
MMIKKEEEIGVLKDRLEQISGNFAELLKQTLTKMQERIDEANQNFEGDQPQLMGDYGTAGYGDASAM